MKIDQQILDGVFLTPRKEQNSQAGQTGPKEDFAAYMGLQENKGLSAPINGIEESSAQLWAASLLGQIQAGQAVGASAPDAAAADVEEEIGSVLNMLEKYMKALGDPQVTLKEISPLVEDLDRGALKLDKMAASLGSDEPIRRLTTETAVLAAVEALKFKRGDFV
ncbi:MAG: hypothetical protein LBJ64_11435 [Deltaproteobacteria bacterium]|nr:hypothetical protein [Deltaproteobacteria bacterium]